MMRLIAPVLGESQQRALNHLKRRGSSTIPDIARSLGLNVETVRAHVRSLRSEGLVERVGRRRNGPGRPEVVYALTDAAEAFFPSLDGALLRDLAAHLEGAGHRALVEGFFEEYIAARRDAAMARVEGLEGDERLDEVARILSDEGFMAEIEIDEAGRRVLRLCHCPLRSVVAVTRTPCRVELDFVRELLGQRLARVSYIPSGDPSCSYRPESTAGPNPSLKER